MLSRGKLVQDWSRRLAAAESEAAQHHRLAWLYQMRARLYRFLLACYRSGDWRADEVSTSAEETQVVTFHSETTTLLDCPLDGKPAKHPGKMQAVLKSVSAAQDHPAEAGPFAGGIAADDWVVAVSSREKLKMAGCQEMLKQFGIVSKWSAEGEIWVRRFDLDQATRIIRQYRHTLVERRMRTSVAYAAVAGRTRTGEAPSWPIRFFFVAVFLAPLYSLVGLLLVQCGAAMYRQVLDAEAVSCWLLICYFIGLQFAILTMFVMDWRRRNEQREEAKVIAKRAKERISPSLENETTAT